MAHNLDYNIINQHLKQLKLQTTTGGPGSALLDENTAIRYVSTLRSDLIALIAIATEGAVKGDEALLDTKTLNEIIVLTKTLDYVPRSDKLFALFDAQLFRSLFNLACLTNIPAEVLRGVLRICLTYLAGVLPKTRKQGMFRVLLGVLCEQVNETSIKSETGEVLRCDLVFGSLASKIAFADARMNLNIVDFVAKVLYRLMETITSNPVTDSTDLTLEEEWLIHVVRSLYTSNFFGILSYIKGIGEIEGMTGLRGSIDLASDWLSKKQVDVTGFLWKECLVLTKELGIVLKSSQKTDTLSVLGLIGCLNYPKRSLKKILVECKMTSTFPILDILASISKDIAGERSLDCIFGTWNTGLWYSLLHVGTRCWLFSGAKIDNNDTGKICNMINSIIDWLAEQLNDGSQDSSASSNGHVNKTNEVSIDTEKNVVSSNALDGVDIVSLLEKVDNFDYNEIKRLQLESLRMKRLKVWKDDIQSFENLVHNQVVSLVRGQRYLQLSKGSWVYATNPLVSTENRHYFISLNSNANSQSLVYKEFSKRPAKSAQTPNLDRDGIHLNFRNIVSIDSENLNPNVQEDGLISIKSERMDVNRIDIEMKNGFFSFYVDTKQLKDIWVDGLRILVSDSKGDTSSSAPNGVSESAPMKLSISEKFFASSGVSNDFKKQVKTLEEIRLRTQMLDLNAHENKNVVVPELNTLSINFHYD